MSRNEKFVEEDEPRNRAGSRRNSASQSRRNSIKNEKDVKRTPLNSAPSSANSTPKRVVKPPNLEFVVTGRQILKRSDRANSLPSYRRQSAESLSSAARRTVESRRGPGPDTPSSKSRETSLEDDLSLDLSQVSDFEDTNSKYGKKHKFLATSTPKNQPKSFQKPRSASLQSQMHSQKVEKERKKEKEAQKSRDSTFCYTRSRDSLYKTSSTASRYAVSTELDCSSVSPGYSGQSGLSSADQSPRMALLNKDLSPRSQELHVSSCCLSSWQDCSEGTTKVEDYRRGDGEWTNFWANYNNSLAKVPMKSYYDQCPTPYRTENIDLADLDFSECSRKRSPDVSNVNTIIRNEGLQLTPRETQNIIKCAHILGNVLTKAIERRSKEKDDDIEKIQEVTENINEEIIDNHIINDTTQKENNISITKEKTDPEIEIKKKTLTLSLKETNVPLEVQEEKRCENVTTQTDISLPNTKSAPRIFEKILRQLSRTSIDESVDKKLPDNKEEDIKIEVKKAD